MNTFVFALFYSINIVPKITSPVYTETPENTKSIEQINMQLGDPSDTGKM